MSKVEEIASRLSPQYKGLTCTWKVASKDGTNDVHMVDFSHIVLDYDKMAKRHHKEGHYTYRLSSNDAVYITDDEILYFVEFKNGSFEKVEIAKKGIGSAMLAMDLGLVHSLKELQERAFYILVYNSEFIENKQTKSQKKISGNLRRKSGRTITKLPVMKEVDWIYHETFSYTVKEFESEFIQKIVEPEYLVAGE